MLRRHICRTLGKEPFLLHIPQHPAAVLQRCAGVLVLLFQPGVLLLQQLVQLPLLCQQGGVQVCRCLFCGGKGSFQLLHQPFQPLLLCLRTDPVVCCGDLFAGGSGKLRLQRIRLLLAPVGLFLCGDAVLLELCRPDPQLFHLLLPGKEPGAALDAAAGKAAACVDDLSVHGDHLVMVAVVPRRAGGFVDVLHHEDAPQKVRNDILVPGVSLHQRRGQPCRAGQPPQEHTGLHGIQR